MVTCLLGGRVCGQQRTDAAAFVAPLRRTSLLSSYQCYFLVGLLLRAVAGLDAAANVLQHALGAVGELPGGLQFKILVQRLSGTGRGNHFARLGVGGGFVDQIYALLIVGVGLVGSAAIDLSKAALASSTLPLLVSTAPWL